MKTETPNRPNKKPENYEDLLFPLYLCFRSFSLDTLQKFDIEIKTAIFDKIGKLGKLWPTLYL